MRLYLVNTEYIDFLRGDPKLHNVFDNKEREGSFKRKYIGIVLNIEEYKYYVPLSSPKDTDYKVINGKKTIRKSIIPIIRIVVKDKNGNDELKGTIKFCSMIPVPDTVISPYNFLEERDDSYRILVQKEYDFIKTNKEKIFRHASVLYNQKTKEKSLFIGDNKKPGYLSNTVDFIYAEQKCNQYICK